MTLIEDDTSAATGAETDAAGESTTIDSQATNDAIVDKTPQDEPAPEVELGPAITPTVGRRVHFWPNEEHAAALGVFDAQQPCDAGIVYVWGDRRVNILVTGPSGTQNTLQGVRLLQGDEQPDEGESYAAWMPYQISQASK